MGSGGTTAWVGGSAVGQVYVNASTTGITSSTYDSFTVLPVQKQKRGPRKPRPIPIFTFNLEERLTKNLRTNARRLVKSLTKKCKSAPAVTSQGTHNVFKFNTIITYYEAQPLMLVHLAATPTLPPTPKRVTKCFELALIIDTDFNLIDYSFTMKGCA